MDKNEQEWTRKLRLTGRFHASGGVCPQTVLWGFASASPAGSSVNPRLREAAGTLAAMRATQRAKCSD
jgi:hypothetical protein